MPQSPSSSSSSEAERDAFSKAAISLIGQIEHLAAGRPANDLMWRDLLARCDMLRAALATPPSLPIDFKQASDAATSHHYSAQSIKALIWELTALEDPRMTTQADFENRDWRAWCGILHRVMSGLAAKVPFASEASEQGGWLPIETAPKDETVLWVFDRFPDNKPWQYECCWNGFEWYHGLGDAWPDPMPTHWRPLPPPPHPEEGALLLGGDEGGKKGGVA